MSGKCFHGEWCSISSIRRICGIRAECLIRIQAQFVTLPTHVCLKELIYQLLLTGRHQGRWCCTFPLAPCSFLRVSRWTMSRAIKDLSGCCQAHSNCRANT